MTPDTDLKDRALGSGSGLPERGLIPWREPCSHFREDVDR